MKLKLTKININPDSEAIQSQTVEEYRIDQERGGGQCYEGKSPPIDYWVEGEAEHAPVCGQSFSFLRTNRNGVKRLGLFSTSPVKTVAKISENKTLLTTENSVYELEWIEG